MSIEISRIQRLRVWSESSFATDGTGTLANFVDVPFVEGSLSMDLTQEMLNPEYAQQHLDGRPTQRLGLKRCTLGFSINLAPTGAAAGNATAAQRSPLGVLLRAVMGGEDLGTGSTINDATPGASENDWTSASGVQLGSIIGMVTDAGRFEARPVRTRSTNTVTNRLAFSEAPDNSDVAYSSATYFLTQDPQESLQFIVEGAESQDRFVLLGCQASSVSLELPIGQLPRMTFQFQGASWLYGDDAATNLTASALASASYTLTSPVHVVGSVFLQDYDVDTLPSALPVSSITLTPSIAYVPQTSPSGVQTIARWRRNRTAPALTGSFVVPFETYAHFDERDTLDLKQLFVQIGDSPGNAVALDVPTMQIINVQPTTDDIRGVKVDFESHLDQRTSGTGDRSKTPFRIAFA